MARFRSVAITCGPLPVRICDKSSPLSRIRNNGDYAVDRIMPIRGRAWGVVPGQGDIGVRLFGIIVAVG